MCYCNIRSLSDANYVLLFAIRNGQDAYIRKEQYSYIKIHFLRKPSTLVGLLLETLLIK